MKSFYKPGPFILLIIILLTAIIIIKENIQQLLLLIIVYIGISFELLKIKLLGRNYSDSMKYQMGFHQQEKIGETIESNKEFEDGEKKK